MCVTFHAVTTRPFQGALSRHDVWRLSHDRRGLARAVPWHHNEARVDMAVGTECRAHSHTEAYGPYTASRVRFAGLQKAQPALDPVSGL
jgi:hypothetical protein